MVSEALCIDAEHYQRIAAKTNFARTDIANAYSRAQREVSDRWQPKLFSSRAAVLAGRCAATRGGFNHSWSSSFSALSLLTPPGLPSRTRSACTATIGRLLTCRGFSRQL